jgi:hyperosmotically inducible protein
MRFRLGALLCLSGVAACSHHSTEAAKDPTYAEQSSLETSPEPALVPASRVEDPAPTRSQTPAGTAAESTDVGSNETASSADSPKASDSPAAPAAAPAPVAPDNTGKNKRDTNSAALTPMDQNNNQTDLQITQKIRQSVMANDSLSFTAKNVKIITQNGKVTLRGPVNSTEERSAIEAAARQVAGSGQVDNQLEVKK